MVQKAVLAFGKHGRPQFMLNRKYRNSQMSHTEYREHIANYLITTHLVSC